MADRRTALLALLTKHADRGWVCPSVRAIEQETGISRNSLGIYFPRLRDEGKIAWRLVGPKYRQTRVVTILETGKATATVDLKPAAAPPAFTPTAESLTSVGRRLVGAEFKRRAAELEKIDAEERRKREMAPW